METFVNRRDVDDLLYFAAVAAAQRVGLSVAGLGTTPRIIHAVKSSNASVGAALDEFISAYLAWFSFWETRKSDEKTDNSEQPVIDGLIAERDRKREALIASF